MAVYFCLVFFYVLLTCTDVVPTYSFVNFASVSKIETVNIDVIMQMLNPCFSFPFHMINEEKKSKNLIF